MMKRLLVSALVALAFACSTGNVDAKSRQCDRCETKFNRCTRLCLHLPGQAAREQCLGRCDNNKTICLKKHNCPDRGNQQTPKS